MKLRAVVGYLYVKGNLFNDVRRVRLAMLRCSRNTPTGRGTEKAFAHCWLKRSVHVSKACITRAPAQTHILKVPAEQALAARSLARPQLDAPLQEFNGLTAEKSHKLPAEGEHARPRRHEQDHLRSQRCRHTHADCPEADRVHVHLTADNQLSRLQPHWPPFWLLSRRRRLGNCSPLYKRWHHDHNSFKLRAGSFLTKMATSTRSARKTTSLPPTKPLPVCESRTSALCSSQKKETTDELMDEQRKTQRGRKEVMHACEMNNSKSLVFEPKRKMDVQKKKTQESEGQEK